MTCFTVLLVRTLTLRFLRMYWYSKQDAAGSHVAVVSIGVGRESILFRSVYEQGLTLVNLSVGRVGWTYGISQTCTSIQNIQFHAVTYTSFNVHYREKVDWWFPGHISLDRIGHVTIQVLPRVPRQVQRDWTM